MIDSVFEVQDKIYIYFDGYGKVEENYVYVSYIDKKTMTYHVEKIEENSNSLFSPCHYINSYCREYFSHNNQIYCQTMKFNNSNRVCGMNGNYHLLYAQYILYTEKNKKMEKILEVDALSDCTLFNISNDNQYAFVISTYSAEDFLKCYGRITIFDFITYREIDRFNIEHLPLYRPIVYFFHWNHEEYIIFQANPYRCTFDNEKWHTYIYSIKEKKVIHEDKKVFSLDYIPERKLLLIQTKYRKIKTIFYEIDEEKVDIQLIIDNLLSTKFLGMKVNKD